MLRPIRRIRQLIRQIMFRQMLLQRDHEILQVLQVDYVEPH